jgi:hypothetical protein
MAKVVGLILTLVGVIALFVGFINGHMMQGNSPHPAFGSTEYEFFGPFSAVSALGIFGGTTSLCYGLAALWASRTPKRSV